VWVRQGRTSLRNSRKVLANLYTLLGGR
jgi:hypothetical protein